MEDVLFGAIHLTVNPLAFWISNRSRTPNAFMAEVAFVERSQGKVFSEVVSAMEVNICIDGV